MRYLTFLFFICVALLTQYADAATARGIVFNDANNNRQYDEGEAGIPEIAVSNGTDVALSNAKGEYTLEVGDDTGIFVIKPTGWMTPVDEYMVPRYYYMHKPEGSPKLHFDGVSPTGSLPEAINFPLYPNDESAPFEILCFGDPQPRNMKEIYYTSHDVVEELIGFDGAFGVTLGDIVFDNLNDLEAAAQHTGQVGVPWYYVIGNHDINRDAKDTKYSDETYERIFGPSYFSLNYGQVHFIVLNNVHWIVEERKYEGRLGEDQLKFIENDLKQVPKDRLIVLFMHIPLTDVADKEKLFEFLQPFKKTFSVSAHWHRQKHYFMGQEYGWPGVEPHHHLVNATVSGGWWSGWLNEYGIPHTTMSDGAPNGYSYVAFDGTDYKVRFKAAGRPDDFQLHIHTPDVIKAAEAEITEVLVNVFAGTEKSTVDMKFGKQGEWEAMEQVNRIDPYSQATYDRAIALIKKIAEDRGLDANNEEVLKGIVREYSPITGLVIPEPRETDHIWRKTLPPNPAPGVHPIHVRTEDMFGQQYDAYRVIRVEE